MAKTFYRFEDYLCPKCGTVLKIRKTDVENILALFCPNEKCSVNICTFAVFDNKPMVYDRKGNPIGRLKDSKGDIIEGNFNP